MKVGFIGVIGRPNVGKSSLVNEIIDYDLAIVSKIAQTTRNKIFGIYQDEDTQMIFIDTPGIHKAQSEFGKHLNEISYSVLRDIDLLLFLQPADEKILKGDLLILNHLKESKTPKIAIITKIDLIKDPAIITEKIEMLKEFNFITVLSTTIKRSWSISMLIEELKKYIKEGTPYYDRDAITNVSTSFIAKEIIRVCVIEYLREELPHSIMVQIDEFDESEKKNVINATIYVEKESQKGIVVGKGGNLIGKIRQKAQLQLEQLLDKKHELHLNVKVLAKWTKNKKYFKAYN